ncbi:MAG: hypothetical protein PHI45_03395 [Candidatus Pacebacteria bacterium]|nr:hypothetical protein [Candidatus Paceibacterota bacterium]MDD5753097.1 hypothetical protein [Candidatus Paceibacterota bacterium]
MESNYLVQIEGFAERHFIKSFEKKYKGHWDITLRAIIFELERIDNLLLTSKADIIIDKENIRIVKTEFKIAGSKESTKTSGNRCIVAWHKEDKLVSVLLVYGKTDLSSGNKETDEWKRMIRENYSQYEHLF